MNTTRTCSSVCFLFPLVIATLFAFFVCQKVDAAYLVSTSEANSRLYSVDASSGSSTLIGSTGIPFLSDIAISGSGDLYGTNGFELYSINPNNAVSSLVDFISGVTFLSGLDFDTSGTLWGVDEGVNEVYTIDTTTAAGTFQFGTGVPFNGDIAHEAGDIFYANGPLLSENNLWELDVNAQTFSDRGTMVPGIFTFPGLDFDANGNLFAFTSDGDIYEIQNYATTATGVFSASSSIMNISGATFLVPEPATILLSTLGLLALGYRRSC